MLQYRAQRVPTAFSALSLIPDRQPQLSRTSIRAIYMGYQYELSTGGWTVFYPCFKKR